MDDRDERLLERLTRADPAIVELAAALVAIPSFAPDHGEAAVVAALMAAASELGLPPGEVLAARPDRPNLLIRLVGRAPGRRLILNGHTDTKPPGNRTDWQRDPLVPAVDGRLLHGLGAADMKGALAAMLHAAAALQREGLPARGELVLLFSADEEASGRLGLAHVLASTGLTADAAVIGEPSGIDRAFDRLAVGARGYHGFALRAAGRRVHSGLAGTAGASPEAIRSLVRVADRLPAAVEFGHRASAGFDLGPTISLTGLSAGVAPGILPAEAVALGEVRTVPGMTWSSTDRALREALGQIRDADGRPYAVELVSEPEDWPASEIDPAEPIVAVFAAATERVLGRPPELAIFPGATEAHAFAARSIPCLPAFGPGRLASAHVPDESVPLEDIAAAARIYALAVAAYLA